MKTKKRKKSVSTLVQLSTYDLHVLNQQDNLHLNNKLTLLDALCVFVNSLQLLSNMAYGLKHQQKINPSY